MSQKEFSENETRKKTIAKLAKVTHKAAKALEQIGSASERESIHGEKAH